MELLQREIQKHWPIADSPLNPLRSVMNDLYQTKLASGQSVILRITHSLHRNLAQLTAEGQWINALSQNGLPSVEMLPASDGQLAKRIMIGARPYFVTAFKCLSGDVLNSTVLDKEKAVQLGRLIGQLHLANQDEVLIKGVLPKRYRYDAEPYCSSPALSYLSNKIKSSYAQHLSNLKEQEHDAALGLIHNDIKLDNFLVAPSGTLQVLDFDMMCYGWYLNDLLTPLYYCYGFTPVVEAPTALTASEFFNALLKGYRQIRPIVVCKNVLTSLLSIREVLCISIMHILCDRKDALIDKLAPYQQLLETRVHKGQLPIEISTLAIE